MSQVSQSVDDLTADVTATAVGHPSVIALVRGIAEQIAGNANDNNKLTELATRLKNTADALADAVTAAPGSTAPRDEHNKPGQDPVVVPQAPHPMASVVDSHPVVEPHRAPAHRKS